MKFNDLVNDVINKEELSLVFGGQEEPKKISACDTQACSGNVSVIAQLCDGAGVCAYKAG